ncbi:hypothetical protein MP638_005068 [Amoeboaphelidium occidentale]|nr:hypothetical protein MP638_005068 [Amoeboaphelidium occidentale]
MAYIKFNLGQFDFDPSRQIELVRILLRCVRVQSDLEPNLIKGIIADEDVTEFVNVFNEAKTLPHSSQNIDVRVAYDDSGDRMEVMAISKEAQMNPSCVPYRVCTIVLFDD